MPAIGSVALHAVLAALYFWHQAEQPPAPLPAPIDPEASSLLTVLTKPITPLVVVKGVGAASSKCPKNTRLTFETGFIYEDETGEIIQAPVDMPAYKAGIRVGDMFVNRGVRPDKDGYMNIEVIHEGVDLVYYIKAVLICYRV